MNHSCKLHSSRKDHFTLTVTGSCIQCTKKIFSKSIQNILKRPNLLTLCSQSYLDIPVQGRINPVLTGSSKKDYSKYIKDTQFDVRSLFHPSKIPFHGSCAHVHL